MPGRRSDDPWQVVGLRLFRGWSPRWLPWVFSIFVAVTAVLMVAYVRGPGVEERQTFYFVSHFLSTVMSTVGVFTSRRGFRGDWLIMLAAMYVWTAAVLVSGLTLDAHGMPTVWAVGIALSLLGYVIMTVGVFRLAWRDGFVRGASVYLDGAVYLVSVLLMWWVLVGEDMVARPDEMTPAVLSAGIVPIGDGLLLFAASALASSRSAHSISSRAIIVSTLAALIGDFTFARFTFGYPVLYPALAALWMTQFAFFAIAALASGRPASRERRQMPLGAIVLVVAALVMPSLSAVYAATIREDGLEAGPDSLAVLGVGTIIMALIVSWRAWLLLRRIQRQAADLERTARTDDLTQLPNRRAGDRLLADAISAAHASGGHRLSVALIDLDRFKHFNDTYGHQRGDQLLRDAGLAWSTGLRGRGTVFRYGGEEFVVVMPGLTVDEGRAVVSELLLATPMGQTFSAGVADLRPGEDAAAVLGRADVALYEAKSTGRARTVPAA